MPKAETVLNASVNPAEPEAKEPNYKVAFEVAANQRDKANQQLCNMQIEMQLMITEKESLETELAALKKRHGE